MSAKLRINPGPLFELYLRGHLKTGRRKLWSVDPYETTHDESSHLDLQCLQIQLLFLALQGLIIG